MPQILSSSAQILMTMAKLLHQKKRWPLRFAALKALENPGIIPSDSQKSMGRRSAAEPGSSTQPLPSTSSSHTSPWSSPRTGESLVEPKPGMTPEHIKDLSTGETLV